ncbi:DNA-binding transcriptional regulator, XRE-family HTH domain [Streptococcus gallolyticus]|uniref:DNA-binding transcriptional regulator, XRE-family HTH domain n=2 Tax=Streptococcus gallolyticus TaxID=315405 RepID=A0A1H9PBY9_9STRE|nr:DNA-binding transcriptional regulator, XRE-family HTH domain [Streptococcus gallolyticus]
MWNQKIFIENLKWLRQMNHLTQEQLALKVGVSRESIAKWENGKMEPTIESIVKLADVFEVSVDELLGVKQPKDLSLLDLLSYCRQNGIVVIYNGSIASATFIDGNGNVKRQLQKYRNMLKEEFKIRS